MIAFIFVFSIFFFQAAAETLNNAPYLDNSSNIVMSSIQEDDVTNNGVFILDLLAGKVTDADAGALEGIAVTSAGNSNGAWECYVGGTWWNIGAVSEASALQLYSDASIRFVPKANWNGTESISFRAWDRTNGAGNRTTADTSVNGGSTAFSSNTATAQITVTPVNDAPYFTDSLGGKVLAFNGIGQYVQLPSGYTGMNGSFTYETWVYNRNVYASWARIFDFGNNVREENTENYNILLCFPGNPGDNGKMLLQAFTYPGTDYNNRYDIKTSEVFPQNQWVHVAAVYDADKKEGYIYWNGVLKASGTMDLSTIPFMQRNYNYIARSNWAQDADFNGYMNDIRLWNVARSQAEIQSNMNRVLSGTEPGLTEYYRVDEGSGTVLDDLAGDANDAAIESAAWTDIAGLNVSASTQGNIPVTVSFMVYDIDDDVNSLQVSAVSDNQTLIPDANLSISGTGALKSIRIVPAANQVGSAAITLTLKDASNASVQAGFPVNVYSPIAPVISTQPSSAAKNSGETAAFTVAASVSDGGSLSYQWQKFTDGGATWNDIAGADSDSYTTEALTDANNGSQYRCVVGNSMNGTTASTISDAATLTQAATTDLTGLVLSGNPANYTFAGGTYIYDGVKVDNSVSAVTVTPTGAGTITVDGIPVNSGEASEGIDLILGVEKTITVVAVETGKSAKTYTIKVTRKMPDVPSAPIISSAAAGDAHVEIAWNSVQGASEYKIYMSTMPGSYGAELETAAGSVYSYDAIGLTNGTTYYFVVKASNPGGDSGYSNELNATPIHHSSGGNSGSHNNPAGPTNNETGIDILVNGKAETAAAAVTTKTDGKTVTTIIVDDKKVEEKLQEAGNNAVVTVPIR